MIVTFSMEIGNGFLSAVQDFSKLEATLRREVLALGREVARLILEGADRELHQGRDKTRYRDKGTRKTCVKTVMGEVEYRRHVYQDREAEGRPCVHLLDEAAGIETVGLLSAGLCRMAAHAVCEGSYRSAGELLSEATGQRISHQGVWNVIQELGKKQEAVVERHAELAERHEGAGRIETKLLYEENDGVWLRLQGESRQVHGPSKEMKVGIAYDGVRWKETASGKRRQLDEKVAYARFGDARTFRRNKEGAVASRFQVGGIELRVVNGDGAGWLRQGNGEGRIEVLDEFHRNRKLTECVGDEGLRAVLRGLLYEKDIPGLMLRIGEEIGLAQDERTRGKLEELRRYYEENRESLLGHYDRGIEIPQTREPGAIHHARLGSMESNVFTLIGNRMKGRRACWSIKGANRLALLLCRQHTTGFGDLFAEPAPLPAKEPEEWETAPILSADKSPECDGKGYEYGTVLSLDDAPGWIGKLVRKLNRP